jgi:hypothetical protein
MDNREEYLDSLRQGVSSIIMRDVPLIFLDDSGSIPQRQWERLTDIIVSVMIRARKDLEDYAVMKP